MPDRAIGTLAAVQTLPFLLLSIPLGLLADRVSRRRLMVLAEGLRALSLFALLAMVVSDHLSMAPACGWPSPDSRCRLG